MKCFLVNLAMVALFAVATARGQTIDPEHPPMPPMERLDSGQVTLQQLLDGVSEHPESQMKRAQLEASKRRIFGQSSLMNPMLMLGIQNLPIPSFSFSEDMMTAKMIGLSQAFPFPGKLHSAELIAAQDTVTMGAETSNQEHLLRRDIKLAYFDIYHLTKSIETNQEHLKVLDKLIALAESQMTIGKSTQQQVLSLQLEHADMQNQIIDDSTTLIMRHADLRKASNARRANVRIQPTLVLPDFPYTLEALDSIADLYSPLLAGTRSRIAQSELESTRAALDKYPDVTVGLTYMQRDASRATDASMSMKRSDMISATLSLDLPINSRKTAEAVGEAQAMASEQRFAAASLSLDLHTMLESQLARLHGYKQQYDLLVSEVYPLAEASAATANANYQYGIVGVDQVMRNDLSLFHREHQRYQLEADYNKAISSIEYLVGRDLVPHTN